MTAEPIPTRRAPTGAVVTFVVAALLYAATMANVGGLHNTDAAGRGLAQAFGAMFGIGLWLALAVLLLIAFVNGRMPRWAGALMVVLHPLAGIACVAATNLYTTEGGWPLAVPAALPPLVAIYALAMRVRALAAPATSVSAGVAAAILLVSVVPLGSAFMQSHPSAAQQAKVRADAEAQQAALDREERDTHEAELAAFNKLNPDSSLRDYLDYLASGGAHSREALSGARLVKTRQSDAAALLRQGRIRDLSDLKGFDLAATPDLCAAYDFGLRVEATKVERGRGAWLTAAMDLERQLPNIKWLTGAGCDLDRSLTLLETNVRTVSDSERLNKFADTLHSFRKAP